MWLGGTRVPIPLHLQVKFRLRFDNLKPLAHSSEIHRKLLQPADTITWSWTATVDLRKAPICSSPVTSDSHRSQQIQPHIGINSRRWPRHVDCGLSTDSAMRYCSDLPEDWTVFRGLLLCQFYFILVITVRIVWMWFGCADQKKMHFALVCLY